MARGNYIDNLWRKGRTPQGVISRNIMEVGLRGSLSASLIKAVENECNRRRYSSKLQLNDVVTNGTGTTPD